MLLQYIAFPVATSPPRLLALKRCGEKYLPSPYIVRVLSQLRDMPQKDLSMRTSSRLRASSDFERRLDVVSERTCCSMRRTRRISFRQFSFMGGPLHSLPVYGGAAWLTELAIIGPCPRRGSEFPNESVHLRRASSSLTGIGAGVSGFSSRRKSGTGSHLRLTYRSAVVPTHT